MRSTEMLAQCGIHTPLPTFACLKKDLILGREPSKSTSPRKSLHMLVSFQYRNLYAFDIVVNGVK